MEVRLLGPVALVDDGRVVSIRQRRQRALLALLALRAGETLAADRLVEDLWGEDGPRTAVASLHNAVSQLRKRLVPGSLVTRAPGYALDVELVSVDVARFEHLLAEARAARSMRDEDTAATILREALGLWHGPALADLAYEPFAQTEITRLEELRQAALEERIDADLARGRHEEVVPELEGLVAAEPLRERLHAQLMLALYRSGRQADALAAYRAARQILVDELAIEPGPELRRLEHAILRQDDALLLPGATPVAPAAPMQFRRLATILLAEALVVPRDDREPDPETAHRLLARYAETAWAVIGRHGGWVDRIGGDVVMAAFGARAADETHALRAARAALDLQAAVGRLSNELGEREPRLELRIGLATGEVLVSDPQSRQQLVTGEAVRVASGLQQAAGAGEVAIGPLAQRLLGSATVTPLGEVSLRGRATPVAAFRLVGLEPAGESTVSRLEAPLVGRRRELGALRAALREVRSTGVLRAVCVVGPAGIGKSRLAREVAHSARGFDVLVARCPSYGEGITYWPLRQLVGSDRDAIRAALEDEPDPDTAADRLARLDAPAPEIASAFRRWCEARARRRPVLLLVDDLHWAEATFLELLEHLVEQGRGPIALLGLARDDLLDDRPGFLEERRVVLDGLASADSETLVDHLLGGAPLPSDSRARVFEAAEGNPLFLEQFVALATEGDPLDGDRPPPATVQALLAARLDRLGPGERAVLERAAVIGREFTADQVTALLEPEAVPAAARHLVSLQRRGFVRSTAAGDLRFRHVLVQEATYRAAPKALRATLHERLADALDREEKGPDFLIGYHLERAYRLRTEIASPDRAARRLAEDAGRRLGAAGVRAWQRYDAPAAANLLERATGLLPAEDAGRLELLCELGEVYKWTNVLDRAEASLREAERIAGSTHNRHLAARARVQQAWGRFVRGKTTAAEMLELTSRAIPLFEAHQDHRALGLAWRVVGAVHGPIRGEWALCADAAARASEHYGQTGFSPAQCLVMLGAALKDGPEPVGSAIERCTLLVAAARGDRIVDAHMRVVLAGLEEMRGNSARAREHLRASSEVIATRGGGTSPDWAWEASTVEIDAGEHEAAAAILESACDAAATRGEDAWVATLSAVLAEVRYEQDLVDAAFELSTTAMERAVEDDLVCQLGWRRVRAKVLARAGAQEEGVRLAREAVVLLGTSDALCERATTMAALAEALHLASHHAEADAVGREAFALFERKGNTTALARAEQRLAGLRPAGIG